MKTYATFCEHLQRNSVNISTKNCRGTRNMCCMSNTLLPLSPAIFFYIIKNDF
jgi:hypothetical protein